MEKIIFLLYRSVRKHKWCAKKEHTVTFSWNRDTRNIWNIARNRKYIWLSNYKVKWIFLCKEKNIIWTKRPEAKQETNESLYQFVTRLRKLATYCKYGNNLNDEIRDQIIHTCKSTKLRTWLLQEQDLTLEKLQNIGRIME